MPENIFDGNAEGYTRFRVTDTVFRHRHELLYAMSNFLFLRE